MHLRKLNPKPQLEELKSKVELEQRERRRLLPKLQLRHKRLLVKNQSTPKVM